MITPGFQKRTPKKQFTKFVKANRLKQHKRVQLPLFNVEGDRCPLNLTVELVLGDKVPLQMELVKDGKTWATNILGQEQNDGATKD